MSGGRVSAALRSLRGSQVRGAILFGLFAWAVWMLMHPGSTIALARAMPAGLFLLGNLIDFQIKAFILLLAIVVADRAVDDGAPRFKIYVLAALIGCLVGVLASEVFGWHWRTYVLPDRWPDDRPWLRGVASYYYYPIYDFPSWLLLGAPAVFVYADRRAAMKTAALLHAAELDRVRRSRIALESRLQAMQARVEPQFLFNTLDQVERLYQQDAALGERMLADLIAYLRAAMPLMRDTSSTVAQELELARSHLDIVKIRLGNRLAFDIAVPPELGSARMPPMMLLPLLDHALGHGLARNGGDATIRIGVGVEAGRLSLRIADTAAGFVTEADGSGIASLRDRLHALYGGDAQLGLRTREGGGSEAVIDVPYEIGAAAIA